MNTITPAAAQALLANGVTLVDIRSADEYAREHIAGAQRLDVAALQAEQFTAPVIFHCRLGQRTRQQAARLRASVRADVAAYLLDGGIEAWKQAGLPVVRDRSQPLELQRQVHIAVRSSSWAPCSVRRSRPGFTGCAPWSAPGWYLPG